MKYLDILQTSPSGDKSIMWESVKRISDFLEKVREAHPQEVKDFLMKEYVALNGRHFNEASARGIVMDMYHTTPDGKRVAGEAVSVDDAQMLIDDKENPDSWRWDAYVAANTMAHDLANTGMGMSQIMNTAKHFFFHDEDFSDENKVFWYYKWRMF